MSYVIEVEFPNGTLLTHSQLATIVNNSAYSMENSKTVPLSLYILRNDVYINFTLPTAGYYTLTLSSYLNTPSTHYSLVYSSSIEGYSSAVDDGLHLYISGPTTVLVNKSSTFYLQFEYSNGSLLSSSASNSLLKNITAEIGNTLLSVSKLSAGDFIVKYTAASPGSYLLTVSGYFNHNGLNLTTSSFYSFYASSEVNELIVVPKDTPASALANISVPYVIEVEFPNGTLLDHAQLETFVNNSAYSMENTKVIPLSLSVSGNELYINFTLPAKGYYTLTLTSFINTLTGHYSLVYSSVIQGTNRISVGIALSMPSVTEQQKTSFIYGVTIMYTNGSRLSYADTSILFGSIILYIESGTSKTPYAPTRFTAGEIYFNITAPADGQYTLLAYVPSTHISTGNVTASSVASLKTQTFALDSNGFVDSINSFIQAIEQNFFITILVTVLLYAIYEILKYISKKIRGDKQTATTINDTILAGALNHLERDFSDKQAILKSYSQLTDSEQLKFLAASDEVLRLEPATIGKRQTDMRSVRNYILKVQHNPDGKGIFSYLKTKIEGNTASSGGSK